MTEKLFTGTLNKNQNKTKNKTKTFCECLQHSKRVIRLLFSSKYPFSFRFQTVRYLHVRCTLFYEYCDKNDQEPKTLPSKPKLEITKLQINILQSEWTVDSVSISFRFRKHQAHTNKLISLKEMVTFVRRNIVHTMLQSFDIIKYH